jgi:hypothetical protein
MSTDTRDPLTEAIQAVDWTGDLPVDAGQRVSRALTRRGRRRRVTVVTGATVAVLAVISGAWFAPRNDTGTTAPAISPPTSTPATGTSWLDIPRHYLHSVSGELTFSAPSSAPRISAEEAISRFCHADCGPARAWYGHIVGHDSEHFQSDAWFIVTGPRWVQAIGPCCNPGPRWAYAVAYGVVDGGNGAVLDSGGGFGVRADTMLPSALVTALQEDSVTAGPPRNPPRVSEARAIRLACRPTVSPPCVAPQAWLVSLTKRGDASSADHPRFWHRDVWVVETETNVSPSLGVYQRIDADTGEYLGGVMLGVTEPGNLTNPSTPR